jgi:MSHA pilin protein MshC
MPAARCSGFSLTELVLILVLVGILAAFAVPRIDIRGFERTTFASELTTALRHAQKIAMASGCHVQVAIDNNGYAVNYTGGGSSTGACGSGSPVPHPTRGGPFTGSGDITQPPGAPIIFNATGGTDTGFAIQVAGGTTINVEAVTGYVH